MTMKTYFCLIVQVSGEVFCVDVTQDSFYHVMDKIPHSTTEEVEDYGVNVTRYYDSNEKFIGFISAREV